MKRELQRINDMRRDIAELRRLAAADVKDARTALRYARALELLRSAETILKQAAFMLYNRTGGTLARSALDWNLTSAQGRLVLAREVLSGKYDKGGPVQTKRG